ncbi:MAG: biotin--[acetyl-CoA-carboxylase] ligase, partial [Frankia sp.]|nr:biotin--[acetyl-CoA-carboxylase] ligase [Frankia sp.]
MTKETAPAARPTPVDQPIADPLDPAALAEAARPAGLRVEVVAETGSTNVDVAGRARA